MDASLADGLTGHTGVGIDVLRRWGKKERGREAERERDRETETHLEGSTISLVHYGAGVHGAIPSMT